MFGAEKAVPRVDLEQRVPVLHGEIRHRARPLKASVEEAHVEAAEALSRDVHEILYGVLARDVGLHKGGLTTVALDRVHRLGRALGIEIADDDARTVAGEQDCRSPTDVCRAAGHDHALADQLPQIAHRSVTTAAVPDDAISWSWSGDPPATPTAPTTSPST